MADREHLYNGPLASLAASIIASLLLSTLLAAEVHAETYTWLDDNGVRNYSERKPRNVPSERVTVMGDRSLPPASSPGATIPAIQPREQVATLPNGSPVPDNLNDEQRRMLLQLQQTEAARRQQVSNVKDANCKRAREVLERLSVNNRIRIQDGANSRVLPEEERQQRIADAQSAMVENCQS